MTNDKISTSERYLTESEKLAIKIWMQKKVPHEEIADRIGIPVDRIKAICRSKRK